MLQQLFYIFLTTLIKELITTFKANCSVLVFFSSIRISQEWLNMFYCTTLKSIVLYLCYISNQKLQICIFTGRRCLDTRGPRRHSSRRCYVACGSQVAGDHHGWTHSGPYPVQRPHQTRTGS